MAGINQIKIKALRQTKNYYLWELKKEGLTEKQRNKFLLALKSIERVIKEKKKSGEKKGG